MKTYSAEVKDQTGKYVFTHIQAESKRDALKKFQQIDQECRIGSIAELDRKGMRLMTKYRIVLTNCHGGTETRQYIDKKQAEAFYNSVSVNPRAVNQLNVWTSKTMKKVTTF